MTEKRFTNNDNNDFNDSLIDCSFTDNLTKKIYSIDEWDRIIGLCNSLWEQTQRFEKHNINLEKENRQLNTVINNLRLVLSEIGRNYDEALESECNTMDENFLLLKDVIQLEKENKQLKSDLKHEFEVSNSLRYVVKEQDKKNEQLKEDLDYFKSKNASLETGMFNLERENEQLQKENSELKSIKRFADDHGINIFSIDEAFHRCWRDNGKLEKENKQLKSHINDTQIAVEIETEKCMQRVFDVIDKKIEAHKDNISKYGFCYGAYLENKLNELKKRS